VKILDDAPDAIGYAFVINCANYTPDAYGSGILFRKLWSKLLDAAALEAIAGALKSEGDPAPVTEEAIRAWFREADSGELSDCQEVPPRAPVETRQSAKSVLFDTCDHWFNDAVLHRNLVTN
jgi:hypothetical protein